MSYRIFESSKELELDVKDIFVELQDKGFDIDIDLRPQGINMFNVGVSNDKLFQWCDISEEFERTKEYLEQNSWILEKIIINYYPKGAFNNHGVKVPSRMKNEKFSGFNFDFFTLFANSLSEDESGIYEVAFIFNPK